MYRFRDQRWILMVKENNGWRYYGGAWELLLVLLVLLVLRLTSAWLVTVTVNTNRTDQRTLVSYLPI
jgi:hypothetical protein